MKDPNPHPLLHLFLLCAVVGALEVKYDSSPFCFNSCSDGAQFTCNCDPLCSSMGDCCIDSANARLATTRFESVQCLATGSGEILVVAKCMPGWRGDASIARGCSRDFSDVSDPMSNIPVTNLQTGVTYKNYHCAICNGANDDVTVWSGGVQCSFPLPGRGLDGMSYNNGSNQWGFWIRDRRNPSETFHACEVVYQMPDDLKSRARVCSVHEISDCDPRWKGHSVEEKCKSYVDPVVSTAGETYRNVHCALCNEVNETLLSCTHRPRPNAMEGAKARPNFMFLVDFSLKDGNCVGQKNPVCETCDEIWDPFFNKCRVVVCALPGYKRKDRACVKA